jgi:hypothetical protein
LLNKQVGAELGISEITVKGYRGKVMQKMKAESFADLVKMAAKLGVAKGLYRTIQTNRVASHIGAVPYYTQVSIANAL